MKYFSKSTTKAPQREPQGETSFSLQSFLFIDNEANDLARVENGDWGGQVGLYWDGDWVSRGLDVEYANYGEDNKLAVLAGMTFPRVRSRFPLYIKGTLGLGYFTGQELARETLTFDYNVYTGVRYRRGTWLFNVEVGSKNYTKVLESAYLNSVVLSSGLSVLF